MTLDTHRRSCVLIVDDNHDAADSLGELLSALGHAVHLEYDGRRAIEAASRLHPRAVILDIGMPGLSGYQVAQMLRSEAGLESSTLIAVSGFAQDSDRMASRAAGFDHHLAKPLDIPQLTRILAASR